MAEQLFSVIIPAYDEEKYLPKCIASIRRAERCLGEDVEIIVADNLSRDRTVQVAEELGARVVSVATKCISAVRNGGAATATGRYLVFIDADDEMSENMLAEIKKVLDSGRYVGGGTFKVLSERWSSGIVTTFVMFYISSILARLSLFLFYTTADNYKAIGGFNESMMASEDWDFARRLRDYGRKKGLKYRNLATASVTKSARKFDEYGDWFIFLQPTRVFKAIRNDAQAVYEFWYRPRR